MSEDFKGWVVSFVFLIITVLYTVFFVLWDKSPFKVWSLIFALLYLLISKMVYEFYIRDGYL